MNHSRASAGFRFPAAIVAFAVLASAPSGVLGWGNEGHQVIALIAADRVTPAALAEVADLLGSDAVRGIEEASTWADYIRLSRPDTAPWHYVNIEVTVKGEPAMSADLQDPASLTKPPPRGP